MSNGEGEVAVLLAVLSGTYIGGGVEDGLTATAAFPLKVRQE
jgi:hypothetical protein